MLTVANPGAQFVCSTLGNVCSSLSRFQHPCPLSPQGDSGGPLVCPVQGVWYLVGVASWSTECLKPVGPSVFAKVSYFSQWIQEKKSANPDPDIVLAPTTEKTPALTTEKTPGLTAFNPQDTVKPQVFMVLLSSQIFLLQLILLRNR